MADLTLNGEKQAIVDLLARGEDAHCEMGVHYNNIVDNKLAEQAGYATAQKFFAKEIAEVSQASLGEYGAVAKTCSEDEAEERAASSCTG